MSLEAVEKVTETEKAVRARRFEAEAEAKKMLADAELRGGERMRRIREEAEAESKKMMLDAENRAEKRTDEIRIAAQAETEELRAAAEKKLENIAELIVERVVK